MPTNYMIIQHRSHVDWMKFLCAVAELEFYVGQSFKKYFQIKNYIYIYIGEILFYEEWKGN